MDCIFCKIANHNIKSEIIFENNDIIAFKDIDPKAPIHILVIPKKHFVSFMDISKKDQDIVFKLWEAVQEIVKQQGVEKQGFRVVVNNGEFGGQAVPHLHLHIMAGRKMLWPAG